MRRMIITRGPQGAGKTTFVRQLGLEEHLISGDQLRMVLSGPVMTPKGAWGRNQDLDARVWRMLRDLLGERMSRGELLVVDATHRRSGDFKDYRTLAATYGYQLLCVDFSTVPLEVCLERNAGRAALEVVPEDVLRRTWEACQRGRVPPDVEVVSWSADDAHTTRARAFLDVPLVDLSVYDSVLHVGDLQGCAAPLLDAGGLLADGWQPGTFHIFVGDLVDRGIENDRVVRWAIEAAPREDVAIVWGNHEENLWSYACGVEARSAEFMERTLPQLRAAGITPEAVGDMLTHLVEVFTYQWRGQRVLVSHAGFPVVPDRLVRLSSQQLQKGPGHYNHPVDERFSRVASPEWIQVHGHRNPTWLPIHATSRSYNLEGSVEHGGSLRAVRLDAEGWTPIQIRNRVHRSLGESMSLGIVRRAETLPPWVEANLPAHPVLDADWFSMIGSHELIKARRSAGRPHISSYNFTRDAFLKGTWDEGNIVARGMFIDTERVEIVARSYDKFFNVNERPETRMEALEETLVFPVTLFTKENGYLGIVGYDGTTDSILFCSKSSLESEHAAWLEERVRAIVGEGGIEPLTMYLRDTHSSMVFEVVEPERDPHVIDYAEPTLVLLDVVRRDPVFQSAPYETLCKVGKMFGFAVKQRAIVFKDHAGFARFVEVCSAPGWTWEGRHIEGFVIEDAKGFQTKLKLHYYNYWKRNRSLKDRILKTRGTDRPLQRDLSDPSVRAFHDWCQRQPDALLEKDLITVRRVYLGEQGLPDMPPPPPPRPTAAVRGVQRALDALQRSVDEGQPLKSSTAEELLLRALEMDGVAEVIASHTLREALLLAVPDAPWRVEVGEKLGVDLDATDTPR